MRKCQPPHKCARIVLFATYTLTFDAHARLYCKCWVSGGAQSNQEFCHEQVHFATGSVRFIVPRKSLVRKVSRAMETLIFALDCTLALAGSLDVNIAVVD
jgi:hypothetical protein